MKKFVLTAMLLVLVVAATPALAQEGLGLYADAAGLSCSVTDLVDGAVKRIYVVHKNSAGASGSEFLVDASSTTLAQFASTVPAGMLSIGSSDTGISIAYQECKIGSFLVLTISFDAFGTTAPCSYVRMLPDPNAVPPVRIWADCNSLTHDFPGGVAIVNEDVTCQCNVAIEQTTWGTIKAMYR